MEECTRFEELISKDEYADELAEHLRSCTACQWKNEGLKKVDELMPPEVQAWLRRRAEQPLPTREAALRFIKQILKLPESE